MSAAIGQKRGAEVYPESCIQANTPKSQKPQAQAFSRVITLIALAALAIATASILLATYCSPLIGVSFFVGVSVLAITIKKYAEYKITRKLAQEKRDNNFQDASKTQKIEPIDGKIADIKLSNVHSFRFIYVSRRDKNLIEYKCKVKMNDGTRKTIFTNERSYDAFLRHLPKEKIVTEIDRYVDVEAAELIEGKIADIELSAVQTFELKIATFLKNKRVYACKIGIDNSFKKLALTENIFQLFLHNLPKEKMNEFALRIADRLAKKAL